MYQPWEARIKQEVRVQHTRFFANFLARLSLLFLSNSMTRRSYGASLHFTRTYQSPIHNPVSEPPKSSPYASRISINAPFIPNFQWVDRTYPETSLTISLTKAVRLLKWPFVREMRGLNSRGVVFCYFQYQSPCPSRYVARV